MTGKPLQLEGTVYGPSETFGFMHMEVPVYISNNQHFNLKFSVNDVAQWLKQSGYEGELKKKGLLSGIFEGAKVKVVIDFKR